MKILLLSGFENSLNQSTALIRTNEQVWVDYQLRKVTKIYRDVCLVLGDKHADDILSESRLFVKSDFVFDANGSDVSLMSNLKAGLYATEKPSFVLPIFTPCPEESVWRTLERHYYRNYNGQAHLIKSFCPSQGTMKNGFPLIVTPTGKKFLFENPDIKDLSDPRLTYLPVATVSPDILKQIQPEV